MNLQSALHAVLGVRVGDVAGGETDARISDPVRLNAPLGSDVLDGLTISPLGRDVAQTYTIGSERAFVYDAFAPRLETWTNAIDSSYLDIAAVSVNGAWPVSYTIFSHAYEGAALPEGDTIWGVTADAAEFLSVVHTVLSYVNMDFYFRLRGGEELPFFTPNMDRAARDGAIIRKQQQIVQNLIDNPRLVFSGSDAAARMTAATMELGGLPENWGERLLTSDCLENARTAAFPDGGFAYATMADRVREIEALLPLADSARSNCLSD